MLETLPQDNRRWMAIMLTALALSILWTLWSRVPTDVTGTDERASSPREGFLAPDFTLDQLGSGQVTLSALRGNVVMVNLWASWCAPCRVEMPAIEKIYQAHKSEGFVVLGLNTTFQDSEFEAAAFVKQLNLSFPILLDRSGATSNRYQLLALPSTYFVDRKGIIRSAVFGTMNDALMESRVAELVKEAP